MNQQFYFDNKPQRGQGNSDQSPRPFYSPNQQSPGNSDFRGFQRRGAYRHPFPQSPYRQHYTPYSSRGSRGNFRGRNSQQFSKRDDIPISKYFHPSMLEDPWAALGKMSDVPGKVKEDADLTIPEDAHEVQETQPEQSDSVQSRENVKDVENCQFSEE